MELETLFNERRSTRKFKEAKINPEDIREIITSAQQAPSWKNFQPARYYVALSSQAKAKVADCLLSMNKDRTVNASYIVTTFVSKQSGFNKDQLPENELGDLWGSYDLGLANSYLILKAKDKGYDTLIMGLRNSDALRTVLDIPETETIVSVIAIGKADQNPVNLKRKEVDSILKIY